jgi:hypothetical protein
VRRAEFKIPGSFPSVANLREHWRKKAQRAREQRFDAKVLAVWNVGLTLSADVQAFGGTVKLTRIAPRGLDTDNLASCLKACRDGIADALGLNDGDARVAWLYAQERCRAGSQAVRVEVEAAKI